jgi:hypothetical protein
MGSWRRMAIVFAAGVAALGVTALAHGAPAVSVTVLSDRYIVDNRVNDDLDNLETELRSSGAKAITLVACGPGTARPQLAAAQRLSDLYVELVVGAPDSSECLAASSPRSVQVSQRIGLRPFGIIDAVVNQWLMQIGGLDGGYEAHAVTAIPYGMPHAG